MVLVPSTFGLPSSDSYSNVRIQKGTLKTQPVVGSNMPATLLSDPSFGDLPPIEDTPFVRQYDGLKKTPQNDLIIMGGRRRKRSLRMKMLLGKNERHGGSMEGVLDIPHEQSNISVANERVSESEDMERSNSFGIGFFNGGAGSQWGGAGCCGGGGGWGGSGWGGGWGGGGSGGWGGWGGNWGGNGWGSGGWGSGCCGGYYG